MRAELLTRATLAVLALLAATLALTALLPVPETLGLYLVVALALIATLAVVPGAWRTLARTTGVGAGAWLLAAAVAGTGLAVAYTTGDPRPLCGGTHHRDCLTLYGWAEVGFVASTLGIAITAGHLGRYRLLRAASVVPAAEVGDSAGGTGDADGGEPVAVEGAVESLGSTRRGPVSGRPAVWCLRVDERPTAFRGHLETERESAGDEFFVRDGSGRVLVLPEGVDEHAAASFARTDASDADDADGAGEGIGAQTEATDGGAERDRRTGRRREWRIEPDDAVTVVGRASDVSRAEYPASVALGLDGPVILANRTPGELRAWAAQRAVVGAAVALVLGGGAFAAMLATA